MSTGGSIRYLTHIKAPSIILDLQDKVIILHREGYHYCFTIRILYGIEQGFFENEENVFDNDEKVFAAIKAGAGGYILKNAEPQHLLQAISEVYNGGAPMTPGIARKVLHQFQTMLPEEEKDYHLSAREKEVLSLLVNGLSYKMIADKLHITYDTVRAHMKKIYEKLHVASMTEAVSKAINQKIVPPK